MTNQHIPVTELEPRVKELAKLLRINWPGPFLDADLPRIWNLEHDDDLNVIKEGESGNETVLVARKDLKPLPSGHTTDMINYRAERLKKCYTIFELFYRYTAGIQGASPNDYAKVATSVLKAISITWFSGSPAWKSAMSCWYEIYHEHYDLKPYLQWPIDDLKSEYLTANNVSRTLTKLGNALGITGGAGVIAGTGGKVVAKAMSQAALEGAAAATLARSAALLTSAGGAAASGGVATLVSAGVILLSMYVVDEAILEIFKILDNESNKKDPPGKITREDWLELHMKATSPQN